MDVIVSEWMGYFLLYESMMDSVVYARDKYLAPGGVCMPDKMVMKVALLNDDQRLNFWDDVYGFDMKHIKNKVRARYLKDPMVEHYEPRQLVSKAVNFKEFDCQRLAVKDLEFSAPFKVRSLHCSQLSLRFFYFYFGSCHVLTSGFGCVSLGSGVGIAGRAVRRAVHVVRHALSVGVRQPGVVLHRARDQHGRGHALETDDVLPRGWPGAEGGRCG